MISRIQELPTSVIAKLRSGITITSVSQCVEELVLNAVDSGATNIAVRVDLGIYRIQVVDNGQGISEEDMKIIGSRYATSKCQNLEDLKSNLTKYGYRGEALASVIQVSGIVDISSRYKMSSKTFEKLFTYGKEKSTTLSKYNRPSCGTTITVQDFMFNMPVRRKLIKEAMDIEYIKSQIERIMLISHNISFSLKNDKNDCYILEIHKSNSLLNSFLQLFGREHEKNMSEVYHTVDQFEIKGYISLQPHQTKSLQFVYINKRAVLHTKIHALVNELISRSSIIRSKILPNSALSGPGKVPSSPPKGLRYYPIYVLNVICPRNEYDVCLEPKKTLVEFRDWDKVLLCVEEMILKFVKEENLTISLDDRFRRTEKEVSPIYVEPPMPHSSQAVLQVFSNTKGKSNLEEQLHKNISENKMKISDIKYAVYGRPARRNNRLITGNDSENINDFNNDKKENVPEEGNDNHHNIKDVEYKRGTKTVQEIENIFGIGTNDSNLKFPHTKNGLQRSSLGALKQVAHSEQQPDINCDNVGSQIDNNATMKTKLSSLQKLRLVNETSNPSDFVTPTQKIIPSASVINRDVETLEETIDIYKCRKLIIHPTNSSSNIKTQSLSHVLSKNFKETFKKKKMLNSLYSFKFEKSSKNKNGEELTPCAKVLDKNLIKKSRQDHVDHLNNAYENFHFNSKLGSTNTNGNIHLDHLSNTNQSSHFNPKLCSTNNGNIHLDHLSNTNQCSHFNPKLGSTNNGNIHLDHLSNADQSSHFNPKLCSTNNGNIHLDHLSNTNQCSHFNPKLGSTNNGNIHLDHLSNADQSSHFNPKLCSTNTNGNKKFFNFDKTEEFSLDSIDVEDLLQDKNTFDDFVMPYKPPHTTCNVFNSMHKEGQTINASSEIKEATRNFPSAETSDSVRISCNKDKELVSESTALLSSEILNELPFHAEETMDIYKCRKPLIHSKNSSSIIKTQSLSHVLSKNFKEIVKKKKILNTLHSFKFDKSIKSKNVEELIPCAKVLDKNFIKKSRQDRLDHLNNVDQSSHFNPKLRNTKFFDFDKTEEFSDSIDEKEDLLQDKNMSDNFVKPYKPLHTTCNVFNSLQKEGQAFNTSSEIVEATEHFPFTVTNDSVRISCDKGKELVSESTGRPLSGKLLNELSFPSAMQDNSKVSNGKTQPFLINNDVEHIPRKIHCNDSSVPDTLVTQPFIINESICDQVGTQNITTKTNVSTQTFNLLQSDNSELRNLASDKDSKTRTHTFNVREVLPSETDVTAAATQVSYESSKSEIKIMRKTTKNMDIDSCVRSLPVGDDVMNDLKLSEYSKNAIGCQNVQISDNSEPSQNQIQSLYMEQQSCSLDMNIEVKDSEKLTLDSLSSETRKNIIDFVSSDKSLSSLAPKQSMSESLKKYSESCKLRFEGKILHIGCGDIVEESNFASQSNKESSDCNKDTAENSIELISSIINRPSANVVSETVSAITNRETNESTVVPNSKSSLPVSSSNSWKRVTNSEGENFYINLRTGNSSFVEPPSDPVPNWKENSLMGCPTLKIPITDEVDPLGVTRRGNVGDQCFSLSHGFEAFLPSKRKQPLEITVDSKIKRISSQLNNMQNNIQVGPIFKDQKKDDCSEPMNGSDKPNTCNHSEISTRQNFQTISCKTDDALNDFLKENFLMDDDDDEWSKWGNSHMENDETDIEEENSNGFLNFWENTGKFAMDTEILGSDLEARGLMGGSYSNVKCYNIVHPYKFTREMLRGCKVFGQVDNKFISIALPFKNISPHLIVLVDQHAADERVQLEKVLLHSYEIKSTLNGSRKKVLRSERIQAPIEASFRADQVRLMKNFREAFFELGLEFTLVNDTSVLFHCIPSCLVAKEPNEKNTRRCQTAALIIEATVVEMCENIRILGGASHLDDEDGMRPLPRPLSHVMNTIACRSAIKFGDELSLMECKQLISLLMECKLPFQCAHGRPSLIPIVDLNYLKLKPRNSKPNLKKLLQSDN